MSVILEVGVFNYFFFFFTLFQYSSLSWLTPKFLLRQLNSFSLNIYFLQKERANASKGNCFAILFKLSLILLVESLLEYAANLSVLKAAHQFSKSYEIFFSKYVKSSYDHFCL